MTNITCDDCGESMDMFEEDSRQEWYEANYRCDNCGKIKTYRWEYDQNGLIISDKII